jgi:hypothetical protein
VAYPDLQRTADRIGAAPGSPMRLVLVGAAVGAVLLVASAVVELTGAADPALPRPSGLPSIPQLPTGVPSLPSFPTGFPTDLPTGFPTDLPTGLPSLPTGLPSLPTVPGGPP